MKKKNNIGLFYKGLAVFAAIGVATTLDFCYTKTSKAVVWTKDALVRGYESKNKIEKLEERKQDKPKSMDEIWGTNWTYVTTNKVGPARLTNDFNWIIR